MAIPRLSVKAGKAGRAKAHGAYISRSGPYANRLERGERLEACEAGNMPAWAQADPLVFWEAADGQERANGTTYREMEIALPREMTPEQRADLVRAFVGQEIGERHAYQWAIHVPKAADGGEQPHAHLMFSERQRDGIERDPEQYFRRYNGKAPERGGARKGYGPHAGQTLTRAERAEDLKALRGRWESLCNEYLALAGLGERIDMRSYAEQGRGLDPEVKQLPSQWRDLARRANVLAFREAKAEQREAEAALRREVPDAGAEIARLEARRESRKRERQAAAQVAAMPAADLVKAWDGERDQLAKGYRQRADRLDSRIRGELAEIGRHRRQSQAAHTTHRPESPQKPEGLFAAFKMRAYGQAQAAWEAALDAWGKGLASIQSWKREREASLRGRLKRLEGYLSRFHHGDPDRATTKAERRLERERPEWRGRIAQAREQVREQEKAQAQASALKRKEARLERERGRKRGRGPDIGF